ncbi:EF-hand calcium-binding domain-containing protein 4B-like isoform X2 [Symsagittifera roscoffensis]|uniref:EF-hand calcium-binding domain-containing protein 4B-like isoform X2 n=1 Tax=Symsagittifera roscoffensis TaxID=84072 RepID=UPI00307C9DAF
MHEEVLCQDPAVDTQNLLREKAVELFGICDKECKGFITRRDLLRLTHELPLTADVLEEVFDRLDDDGNGYLSFEEFTDGFGQFLSYVDGHEDEDPVEVAAKGHKKNSVATNGSSNDPNEDGEQFEQLLQQLKGHEVVPDANSLKHIWTRLRSTDPNSVNLFEDFLSKMVRDMRATVAEQRELEEALKTRAVLHDEELSKLYEEMEAQLDMERQRVKRQEQDREQKVREEMLEELQQKERQLQELIQKKNSLGEQVKKLQGDETSVRMENDLLLQKNDELEDTVRKLDTSYHETQQYLKTIKDQMNQEKRERARAALKVNESIAKERTTLVQQLDQLREENKLLKDERDELVTFKASVGMIENLLKQVQDKGTIEVSTEDDEEEADDDETANDVSEIASLSEFEEEDEGTAEEGNATASKEANLSAEVSICVTDHGDGENVTSIPLSSSRAQEGADLVDADVRGELATHGNEVQNKDGGVSKTDGPGRAKLGVRSSNRRRSLSLKRADGSSGSTEKATKGIRRRHTSKNKDKAATTLTVGGNLEKGKSISVEKFSSNLSALLSTNQLDLTTLKLPTNHAADGPRRGSIIGSYMPPGGDSGRGGEGEDTDEDVDFEDEMEAEERMGLQRNAKQLFLQDADGSHINWERRNSSRSMETINLNNSAFHLNNMGQGASFDTVEGEDGEDKLGLMCNAIRESSLTPQNQFQEMNGDQLMDITRHRVFKIVFVGDSGVGKSSYISRVCRDQFSASLPATVGVDYHVKQLVLDNVCYSLQFWDTAGQERYRSITKQYFRRTDAIVVMYDVTNERSLLNVRQWVEEIREEIDTEDILLFLLGSKMDLKFEPDLKLHPIDQEEGRILADQCGAFFMEVSSRSGDGISDSVQLLAQELAKLEDKDLENAKNIVLKTKKKKSGCC